MSKKAIITGVSGQDGYYLSKLLLGKGYEVHGLDLVHNLDATRERLSGVELHVSNILEKDELLKLIYDISPDEIYNLAAQSSEAHSIRFPDQTIDVNVIGLLNILECIRSHLTETRLFQASSANIFGTKPGVKTEDTAIDSKSPYAVSKAAAHLLIKSYRETYGLFLANGILYPHESKLRGEQFVARKITKAVAAIKLGKQDKLTIGNIKIRRDWGAAEDYVRAMYLSLQHDKPGDYIISAGESFSIEDILKISFDYVNLDWKKYTEFDKKLVRTVDIPELIGDNSKAKKLLDWKPEIIFKELIESMVQNDLDELELKLGK